MVKSHNVLPTRLLPISELRRRKQNSSISSISIFSTIITYLRVKETKTGVITNTTTLGQVIITYLRVKETKTACLTWLMLKNDSRIITYLRVKETKTGSALFQGAIAEWIITYLRVKETKTSKSENAI